MCDEKGKKGLRAVYDHRAVRLVGTWLHWALANDNDYASLVGFEGVEQPEEFAEALRAFLRRHAREDWKPLDGNDLVELAGLVDEYTVPVVRAAILSHALVRVPKKEKPAAAQA